MNVTYDRNRSPWGRGLPALLSAMIASMRARSAPRGRDSDADPVRMTDSPRPTQPAKSPSGLDRVIYSTRQLWPGSTFLEAHVVSCCIQRHRDTGSFASFMINSTCGRGKWSARSRTTIPPTMQRSHLAQALLRSPCRSPTSVAQLSGGHPHAQNGSMHLVNSGFKNEPIPT